MFSGEAYPHTPNPRTSMLHMINSSPFKLLLLLLLLLPSDAGYFRVSSCPGVSFPRWSSSYCSFVRQRNNRWICWWHSYIRWKSNESWKYWERLGSNQWLQIIKSYWQRKFWKGTVSTCRYIYFVHVCTCTCNKYMYSMWHWFYTSPSFIQVYLGRHKDSGKHFAIKVLQKKAIVKRNEVKHIMAERNVLLRNVKHPFLVGLHYSFQSSTKLYFVLDYVNGGELFFHLQRERVFEEPRARYIYSYIIHVYMYMCMSIKSHHTVQ